MYGNGARIGMVVILHIIIQILQVHIQVLLAFSVVAVGFMIIGEVVCRRDYMVSQIKGRKILASASPYNHF